MYDLCRLAGQPPLQVDARQAHVLRRLAPVLDGRRRELVNVRPSFELGNSSAVGQSSDTLEHNSNSSRQSCD